MASEITLHNMDCMEAMKQMPDKAFDLAIVDPPYFKDLGKFDYQKGRSLKNSNSPNVKRLKLSGTLEAVPDRKYIDELMRCSKHQIIWGANHFMSAVPFDSSCWIVWDKVLSCKNFADAELAWTSFKSAVRIFKYTWNGFIQENMSTKEIKIHPNQKPIDLYRWILKHYATPNAKILDTHLGSGSIAIACYDMGFDLTAYEIDLDYFNAAVKRLEAHKKQITFFDGDVHEAENRPPCGKDDTKTEGYPSDSLF